MHKQFVNMQFKKFVFYLSNSQVKDDFGNIGKLSSNSAENGGGISLQEIE
jgi:hypothetical protein